MQSAKVILVQFLLVACLVGLVLSAPTEQNDGSAMTPEACEQFAKGFKIGFKPFKGNVEVLCGIGSPETQKLCREKVEGVISHFESLTSEQICAVLCPGGKLPDVSSPLHALGLPGLF